MKRNLKYLLVLALILSFLASLAFNLNSSRDSYKGSIYLLTPEHHQQFLNAIGKSDVNAITLRFSSNSPTSVTFTVIVPQGYSFPYGKEIFLPGLETPIMFSIFFTMGVGLFWFIGLKD